MRLSTACLSSALAGAVVASVIPQHLSADVELKRDSSAADTSSAVRLIYQYPLGTWIENLAIRPSGELLVTLLYNDTLDQINPFASNAVPTTISKFPHYTSVSAITEIQHDVFSVAVGNFTPSGTWTIWNANFTGYSPVVKKFVSIPSFVFPDGMTNLLSTKSPNDILVGDIKTGNIWHIDSTTGAQQVVISNNYTAPYPDPVFTSSGVNGIHVRNGTLYFDNTGLEYLYSVPINDNGTPTGPVHTIAPARNSSLEFDDFALKGDYVYAVTGSGNSIERISLVDPTQRKIIAGSLNSTLIAEPTSCAFGRTANDAHILYVVTGGGLAAPVSGKYRVGAQVLAIDTTKTG